MQMTQLLAGYSAGQADSFRKAIGKKKQSVMDIELPKLHQAIEANGYSEEIATHVIELIKPFVGGYAPLGSNSYRRTLLIAGNSDRVKPKTISSEAFIEKG